VPPTQPAPSMTLMTTHTARAIGGSRWAMQCNESMTEIICTALLINIQQCTQTLSTDERVPAVQDELVGLFRLCFYEIVSENSGI
jgi:hypothetical protein